MNNVFFTSDNHFGHARIIEYCNRPFKHVDEMNEAMIANWNNKIDPEDTVYHIGDFAMDKNPSKFLYRLNGQKFLIKGNHDGKPRKEDGWAGIWDYREIRVENQFIVLCHYALRVWNKSHYGSWNLFGHSHGSLPDDPTVLSIDVGVDCHDYTPISFEEIKEIMDRKTPKSDARNRGKNHKPKNL